MTAAAPILAKKQKHWVSALLSGPINIQKQTINSFFQQFSAQIPLLLVHGSPRKINEYLFADWLDATLERLMDMKEADVLVCGHIHISYHRILPSGRHVVNAGSVGKPKDKNPQVCYMVLEANGKDLAVNFMRVP